MGDFRESMDTNIRRIAEAVAGSGINVNANFNVGDVVGLTNAAGDPIDPARLQDINNLRLDTARITQPSGQRPLANSESVVWASNAPILPVSVTVSGQQPMTNSVSVVLATDSVVQTVALAGSGIQYAATAGSQSGVLVSVAATLIVGSNPLRKSLLISHIGTSGILYIGPTNAVSSGLANAGTYIAPASTYSDSAPGIYTGTIWGIMDKSYSQQSVSIWERI